jgi:type II secretory pathway predicted ATPase ExeA
MLSNVKRLPNLRAPVNNPVRTPADTPAGAKPATAIALRGIAADMGVTLTDMADVAGISRRTLQRVLCENVWPRADREAMKDALRVLLAERGATARQVAGLFRPEARGAAEPKATPKPNRSQGRASQAPAQPLEDTMLLAKQSLTPAARKAWTLFTNPFDGEVTSDEQMFVNSEIAYVREAAYQAAVGGRFVAIAGESGSGKSTLMEDLEARIERDRRPVRVIRPSVVGMVPTNKHGAINKIGEILHAIVTSMDPRARPMPTLQARTEQVERLLTESAGAGHTHLLLIEEAHSLSDITIAQCKRLNEIKAGRKVLLGILLVGQTELAQRLDPRRADLREVTQRIELVRLLPLDGDLQAYLEHRAKAAGRKLGDFLAPDAVDEIRARLTVRREGAGGKSKATSLMYPLCVNNLVTAALNQAADLGVPVVDRNVVRSL